MPDDFRSDPLDRTVRAYVYSPDGDALDQTIPHRVFEKTYKAVSEREALVSFYQEAQFAGCALNLPEISVRIAKPAKARLAP